MKKTLSTLIAISSFSAFAAGPQFSNLTKGQIEDVTQEFGANFSHTAVAAPETEGVWGVEFGAVGGNTPSPEFKDAVTASGGDGKDFKNLYHAGVMARAHFPLELFAELTYLPSTDLSDVTVENKSFGLGWNAGSFFELPVDAAIGANFASGEVSFKQTTPVNSTINLEMQSRVYWLGVSKRFAFFTPYAKVGMASIEGDFKATATTVLASGRQTQDVNVSGSYYAVGANFQVFFLRLGIEASKTVDVGRLSGKFSFAF